MYQRDYLLRMIEMIGDFIAGIMGMIRKRRFEEASDSLRDAFREYLKEDAAFFQNIPKEQLTDKLLGEHHYTHGHLEILSYLFYAQAEISYAQDKKAESCEYYEKSLNLMDYITRASKTFSADQQAKMDEMRARIAEIQGIPN
jgi:hypothetical protein